MLDVEAEPSRVVLTEKMDTSDLKQVSGCQRSSCEFGLPGKPVRGGTLPG